jgi:hypothetical protein
MVLLIKISILGIFHLRRLQKHGLVTVPPKAAAPLGIVHLGMVHLGVVHLGIIYLGIVHLGMVRLRMVRPRMVHLGMVYLGMVYLGIVHLGMVCLRMVRLGIVYLGIVRLGMVYLGMVLEIPVEYVIIKLPKTTKLVQSILMVIEIYKGNYMLNISTAILTVSGETGSMTTII